MPTWQQLKAHARSRYAVAEEQERSFKLVFEVPDGRLRALVVSHYEAAGRGWCDFSSACCREDKLDPKEALIKNFSLAVGGLCLDQDVYVFRYVVALDSLNLLEFDVPIHIVVQTSERIAAELKEAAA